MLFPSGLPLVQSSKRSHMHLSTSALGNASASLHYPMPPCHYSNQQTTYGMMAGTSSYAQVTQVIQVLFFCALLYIINTHRNTGCSLCVCECGNDVWSVSPAQEMLSASISQTRILQTCSMPHANMVNGANSLQGTTCAWIQTFSPMTFTCTQCVLANTTTTCTYFRVRQNK